MKQERKLIMIQKKIYFISAEYRDKIQSEIPVSIKGAYPQVLPTHNLIQSPHE